ncbi:MAG TPA: YceI family protein [Terracidiphilus sp.]|jgi:polyisoprenoid-binding protein YceI|nr:YceI family protein [Terracidiphilus sp.]
MKHLATVFGTLALAAPLAMAQTSTWVSDPVHSEIDFTITHLSISNVHGRFGKVAASLVYDPADVTKSNVTATIDVSTVDTGEEARNTHLKTPDFFDLAQFPTATFKSTGAAKSSNGLAVTGNLTLHGVTRPVVLNVEGPTGPVQGMDKKQHSGFSATTTISRSAFGIGPKFPPSIVGDEVKLSLDLDVAKQ